MAGGELAHLGGLADAVAPAPVVWVPFLSTDVHDIAGMGGLAAHLFSRLSGPYSSMEAAAS